MRLSARPTDAHPYDFDPAAVRIVRADRVQRGDVVLGEVYDYNPGHTAAVSYLPYGCIPYVARPRPVDPARPCELCSQRRADPFTYLTNPIALTVWPREDLDPVCQVNNADELLVVVPARWAAQSAGRRVAAGTGSAGRGRQDDRDRPEPHGEDGGEPVTGRDWRQMRRADFDESAPPVLVDEVTARAWARVPATPDAYGTAALFGDEMPTRQSTPRRAAQREQPQADGLF